MSPNKASLNENSSHEEKKDNDRKIECIIQSLDFLRDEAQKSGNNDIYKLIDSFATCLHTYCNLKKGNASSFQLEKNPDQD